MSIIFVCLSVSVCLFGGGSFSLLISIWWTTRIAVWGEGGGARLVHFIAFASVKVHSEFSNMVLTNKTKRQAVRSACFPIYSTFSFIRGGWLIPDFIVELDGVLKGIVLFEGIIRAAKLLHCAANFHANWLSLTRRDWPACDVTTHIDFATSATNLWGSLQKQQATRRKAISYQSQHRESDHSFLSTYFIYFLPCLLFSFAQDEVKDSVWNIINPWLVGRSFGRMDWGL